MQEQQIIIYEAGNGQPKIEVRLQNETVWLTQKIMAKLFGVDRSVVTKHLKNIFESGELDENSVCANFAHTASDGKTYNTKHYNLDVIIALGYRVNSKKATQKAEEEYKKYQSKTLSKAEKDYLEAIKVLEKKAKKRIVKGKKR